MLSDRSLIVFWAQSHGLIAVCHGSHDERLTEAAPLRPLMVPPALCLCSSDEGCRFLTVVTRLANNEFKCVVSQLPSCVLRLSSATLVFFNVQAEFAQRLLLM